jgi:hypothetical protein
MCRKATAGNGLQRIWAIGLMGSWFCVWVIWQIRIMGLI